MNGRNTEILDVIQNANPKSELWMTRETFNSLSSEARSFLREDGKFILAFINKDGAVAVVYSVGMLFNAETSEIISVQVHEVNYLSGKQFAFPEDAKKENPTII